jgi:hypothetical protein
MRTHKDPSLLTPKQPKVKPVESPFWDNPTGSTQDSPYLQYKHYGMLGF